MKKLVTHNGTFHADDLFACSTLSLFLEKKGRKFEVLRTRDIELVKHGDYVFDVGGIYDPETNNFDHHQKGGAGERENGIPYSSFGLVWKHFGMELCDGDVKAWEIIDTKIASPIDAVDNGVDIMDLKFHGIRPYGGEQQFLIYAPTWQEDESKTDEIFREQVKKIMKVLEREIVVAKANSLGRSLIEEAYRNSPDPRVIELPRPGFPRYLYQETLSSFPEPMYIVYKSSHSETWKVEAVSKSPETLESRKSFPEPWRGFMNSDPKFAEITGVPDAQFCHRGGFLLTVKSKEGAMKLAELALNS